MNSWTTNAKQNTINTNSFKQNRACAANRKHNNTHNQKNNKHNQKTTTRKQNGAT